MVIESTLLADKIGTTSGNDYGETRVYSLIASRTYLSSEGSSITLLSEGVKESSGIEGVDILTRHASKSQFNGIQSYRGPGGKAREPVGQAVRFVE